MLSIYKRFQSRFILTFAFFILTKVQEVPAVPEVSEVPKGVRHLVKAFEIINVFKGVRHLIQSLEPLEPYKKAKG